jgi:hypothetical protein
MELRLLIYLRRLFQMSTDKSRAMEVTMPNYNDPSEAYFNRGIPARSRASADDPDGDVETNSSRVQYQPGLGMEILYLHLNQMKSNLSLLKF